MASQNEQDDGGVVAECYGPFLKPPGSPRSGRPVEQPAGGAWIFVPLSRVDPPAPRQITVGLLPHQGQTLCEIFGALHEKDAMFKNGRHVDAPCDAVGWLLEEVARAYGAERRRGGSGQAGAQADSLDGSDE